MASVLTYGPDRAFYIKIFKRLNGQTAREWSNGTKCMSIADGVLGDLVSFGFAHVAFEAAIHDPSVRFTRLLISTAAQEAPGAAFETFAEYPLDELGTRGGAIGEPLDLRITAWIGKIAETGRPGKYFYRRCLGEGDVVSSQGAFTFSSTTFATDVADAVEAADLARWFKDGSNNILRERLINFDGSQYRDVINYITSGIVPLKTDHRYFDRA